MSANPFTYVIILALSPVVIFLGHTFLSRLLKAVPRQVTAGLAMIIGFFPVAALEWLFILKNSALSHPDFKAGMIYSIFVYSSIAYSYFHLFNMSETARRIRIFHEIYKKGSVTRKDIEILYDSSQIVGIRLIRLEDTGQLVKIGNFYKIKGRSLLWVAKIIKIWDTLLAHPRPM